VYDTAAALEEAGKLRQARDMFLSGAKARCIAPIRQRCMNRYKQLEADIPSIVPTVAGEDGEPRVDVQVSIDNELLTSHLDGRSLPIDPGMHEFTFRIDGKVVGTEKIMIVQGQRNRPISIAMRADKSGEAVLELEKREPEALAPETAEPERAKPEKTKPERSAPERSASDSEPVDSRGPRGPGAIPYVVGTVGFVGLASAGLLTYWGRKDNDLLARCAPNCSPDSVDHVRHLYVAADLSLGVGAAALATSVVWFLASPSSKDKPQARTSHRIDVQPAASGGFATLSGSF
jgi:hypothetical protein